MNIDIFLQPKQKIFLETIEEKSVTFYGGAKGGGKSKGLLLIWLLRRFKYKGSTGAIFRRTYPELEGNHIRPLFEAYPQLRAYWNESKKLLTLPNGSTLQFCHCNNENDVALYQGREFHDLAIDEAGQWPEAMFRRLLGSNRSSKINIKARCALTGNPGGIGHGWLKRLFIERRFNEREIPDDYAFIQALVDDNPALIENDPTYLRKLDSEPNEALRKAFRYGDWNIFAGQFFQEITKEVHFIEPFAIPPHWERFCAYDYGFNHPAAFGWFATSEDGEVYLYREFISAGLRIDQFSRRINLSGLNGNQVVYAGHDSFINRKILKDEAGPPTIAEEFASHGIYLKKAEIDRIQGAAQVRSYLAWQGKPNKRPRYFIFNTCPISFDTLSRMIHDPDKPEDVLKVDATEGEPASGDDAYDMIRYALMSRPKITEAPDPKIVIGSPEWHRKQNENLFDQEIEKARQDIRDNPDESGWPRDY